MKNNTQQKLKKSIDIGSILFFRLMLWLLSFLPYKTRVSFGSNFFSIAISPLLGNSKRINENFSFVLPNLTKQEKNRLIRSINRNIGRTIFELFSPDDFSNFASKAIITGPGFEKVKSANNLHQPVILVSGHYGNYDVVRAKLQHEKIQVGALYKPMQNTYFNELYLENISKIGQPLFPRGRNGMSDMVTFLKKGNCIAVLFDQVMGRGEPLSFFGKTAYTATSVAKMAIKYDALLIPFFAERQSDGFNFELHFGHPILHSKPEKMTQQLNDLLEQRIRTKMDHWLWTHKRWKTPLT